PLRTLTGYAKVALMSNLSRQAAGLAVSAALMFGGALAGDAHAASTPPIVHLTLNGVVDPMEASYLQNGISAAQAANAPAVLITIDTPGGLDSSMREIIQAILGANVPVICYVSPEGARAASAGTFIMMSCPIAAMAPGIEIGAAQPVGV